MFKKQACTLGTDGLDGEKGVLAKKGFSKLPEINFPGSQR